MSFWSDPGKSLEGFAHDPWHGLQNFMTTGVVPVLPYVAGAIGGVFGGPGGAAAAGSATQETIDYFSGNSKARTGQGILGSLTSGAGKGMMGSSAYSFGAGAGGDTGGDSTGLGGQGMSMLSKAVSSLLKNYQGSQSPTGQSTGQSGSPLSMFGGGGSKPNDVKLTWQEELAKLQELVKGEEGKDDGI
jgi:hypothetical protein